MVPNCHLNIIYCFQSRNTHQIKLESTVYNQETISELIIFIVFSFCSFNFTRTNMATQTLSLCTLHPTLSPLPGFTKTLKNPSIFSLRTHNKMTNRSNNSYRRVTVFAVKGEEEQSTPSWAKPDSEEPPPWARNETQQTSSSSSFEFPFFVYLLASAITAIAAVGSVFEYVNQKPVFGVLNSDSIFYAPVLGFFAITGIPTAAFLWFKSVEVANKEAEEQDKRDGYR